MKNLYPVISLLCSLVVLLLSSCDKKSVAPSPTLKGTWKADSVRTAFYSAGNIVGPFSTLLAAPNTTLTFEVATLTDMGSLSFVGSATSPATYSYVCTDNSLTLTHPTLAIQYTGVVALLTANRLQLDFVRPGVFGGTPIHRATFYSR